MLVCPPLWPEVTQYPTPMGVGRGWDIRGGVQVSWEHYSLPHKPWRLATGPPLASQGGHTLPGFAPVASWSVKTSASNSRFMPRAGHRQHLGGFRAHLSPWPLGGWAEWAAGLCALPRSPHICHLAELLCRSIPPSPMLPLHLSLFLCLSLLSWLQILASPSSSALASGLQLLTSSLSPAPGVWGGAGWGGG